ncbi:MAG: glycosyltransferase family 4 protein [Chloroflexota bacterium]|nr:glycosyltransferase family 4 protein [Chloroflexota bacterium]MDE3192525.1 glycosyltransferase family 4 protein [Chloroflexota bacterium]
MKIGIVSPYAYPRPGGANSYIREQYEQLRDLGHEVRIITAPWGDDPPARDVIQIGQAIAVPYNGSIGRVTLSLRLEWLVSRMLKREHFDVIHHHEPLVPFLSMQILDRAKCPNVATFHAFGGFSLSYWLGRPFGEHYMDKLDARIAVSTAAKHHVSRYFPGEYRIIPNGVDVDQFANARPFPEYRDGKVNILFVGRLEPRKGAMHLLRAYALLKPRYPNTRLIVCNWGPQLGNLRRFVRSQGLGDVLFAGRVSDIDKARFYKTADIFCAPSTGQESFGIVLLEAMAAGRAVVASDIHGYKRVVQRNVSGLLVEPKEPEELAQAIARLIDDPALRDRLGAAGAERAKEFDWEHVARQLVEVYEEVLSRRPAAATEEVPEELQP